jgi:tetratricopeptide (TPR) repeat protein
VTNLARLVGAAALALLLWPEIARYRAERQVRRGSDALRQALAGASDDRTRILLDRAAKMAAKATPNLPGDPRPRLLAGSARLVQGKGLEALDFYRDALATGERAEIDLNIGRAHAIARERPEAQTALLRALWISPTLASALPGPVAKRLLEDVAKRENDLKAGLLNEPPPLPD